MKENYSLYRNLAIALGIILLWNPIVIYAVIGKFWISFGLFAVVIFSAALLFSRGYLKYMQLLFFNLLFIVSILFHAELIFNSVFSDYIIEDLYRFEKNYYFNKPDLDKFFEDKEYRVNYKTNRQGFRIGVEDSPETTVEKIDWLFLGDSYTQGAQVQFEELYTKRLEQHFPDKIILNAGISGFGIPDEYFYYTSEGVKFSPKKVFLQVCNFNDFMMVEERRASFIDDLMQYSNFARFILYGFRYANPAELPLGRWTEPFYPSETDNANLNVFFVNESEQKSRDLAQFKLYLGQLSSAVQKSGAELVVVQIPTKEQTYFRFFQEVVDGFRLDVTKINMDYPNKLLSDWCEELGVEYISMLDAFQSAELPVFYEFDEHLNTFGHQVVADHIASVLDVSIQTAGFRISSDNLWDRYPTPSTNYSSFTYQSSRDGNMEIFVADSLFENRTRITFNSVDESHPIVAGGRKVVAFTEGNQETGETKVIVQDLVTGSRKNITSGKFNFEAIPFFSRNEKYLAFASWEKDSITHKMNNPSITILNLDNDIRSQITDDKFESWRPVFSHDDTKIYYISKRENDRFAVYENTIAGDNERLLIDTGFDIWDPAISPDGSLLAFAGHKNGNWDLFVYRFSDETIFQLTDTIRDEWDPAFSADSELLYFACESGLSNGIYAIPIFEELSKAESR